jgi:adenylosuccinate lyase
MAHKRNPITFENIEGMWLKTKNEFGKVFDSLLSDHQRDLVSSSIYRDFPIIIINLVNQIDSLCKQNQEGAAFLSRISINEKTCTRNVKLQGSAIIAEPLYIALQISGYNGDAHDYVNHKLMPLMAKISFTVYGAIKETGDEEAMLAFEKIPKPILDILMNPSSYIGDSKAKALQITSLAEKFIKDISSDRSK